MTSYKQVFCHKKNILILGSAKKHYIYAEPNNHNLINIFSPISKFFRGNTESFGKFFIKI